MPVTYDENKAVFDGTVTVEDAETLLEWLQDHQHGTADLAACTHLHAADLQLLMAAGIRIAQWPADDDLKTWMKAALPAGTSAGP